jgi:hypothetical protein
MPRYVRLPAMIESQPTPTHIGGSGMQTVPMVGNGAVEELLEESAGGGPEQDAQPGTPAATPQGVST